MRDLFFEDSHIEDQLPSEKRVYSVSQITREIKCSLEEGFTGLWLEGEISNFKRHSSGHLYFSLKDMDAQIACVMWRGRNQNLLFQPQDGMKVLIFGDVTVYERQGKYQLDTIRIQPAGIGELQLAYEALKQKLEKEGLFLSEHKKSIPAFPQRIGIITSSTGAAIRDIVSVISRRFPSVQLILIPARVQGEGAAQDITEAIQTFNQYSQVDVLIIGRGGGSLEDLWAFNEEIVARAIFESKIPVISAVGHEIDFSISDFVADLRAPTPSAAAELVVKNREEIKLSMAHSAERMYRAISVNLKDHRERINHFRKSYGFRWPLDRIREYRLRIDDAARNLETHVNHHLQTLQSNILRIHKNLRALSPEAVLNRGYSITTRIDNDQVVRRAVEMQEEDEVRIRFAQGAVRSVIKTIE